MLCTEPDEYCLCCRSKGESDLWWERPYTIKFFWAKRLHMQRQQRPCIWHLCSIVRLLAVFYCSKRLLRCRGRRRTLRSIVCLPSSQRSPHLCTLRVEWLCPTYTWCRFRAFRCRIVTWVGWNLSRLWSRRRILRLIGIWIDWKRERDRKFVNPTNIMYYGIHSWEPY